MAKRTLTIGLVALVGSIGLMVPSFTQSLIWLGTLGGNESVASDVSADGTVVVGWSRVAGGHRKPFRWTRQGGLQNLGTFGGNEGWANGVSADGIVVVGTAQNTAGGWLAFRWSPTSSMQQLVGFEAVDVSANGSVIVGTMWSANRRTAYRWVNGTAQEIYRTDYCFGGTSIRMDSGAHGVSMDGSIVVGRTEHYVDCGVAPTGCAFSWANGNMYILDGCNWDVSTVAEKVSADGSVVVGWIVQYVPQAVVWVNGRMHYLPPATSEEGAAYGVTADGTKIVGWYTDVSSGAYNQPCLWSSGRVYNLNLLYARLLQGGSSLKSATAISLDGRYIVGQGYNARTQRNEAFLIDTWWNPVDVNNDGCIADDDLLAVLNAYGTPGTGYTRHEDINKDGIVDDADLLAVLYNFGRC